MGDKLDQLSQRLADERSRRVMFVAHCVLNENARYQGGAFTPGCIEAIVQQLVRHGVGIVQMKCPEQLAWGGVRRVLMWLPMGWGRNRLYRLIQRPFVSSFILYTRWAWRRIARQTVREIADWRRSGHEVLGIIGVRGSPSCGVHDTLDLHKGAAFIGLLTPDEVERERLNRDGIRAAMVPGRGYYIAALQAELDRRGLEVPFYEHDLVAELERRPTTLELDLG